MCMTLCVRMMFVYMSICLNSAHLRPELETVLYTHQALAPNSAHLRPELQTVLYTHQALAPGTVASDCSHCNMSK